MCNCKNKQLKHPNHSKTRSRGFTLIEMVIVMLIIAVASGFIVSRLGFFSFWKQEGSIKRLSEVIEFLHHQAVADQAHYKLEFNLDEDSYRVGVFQPELISEDDNLSILASDAGYLSLELAAFLNPANATEGTLIPPPSFPSLAQPISLKPEIVIEDIRTMRGKKLASEGGTAFIMFSPRGFSEFSVIHLNAGEVTKVTILVNPFTGLTEIFQGTEFKDFEWTFGRNNDS
ncbi:MAG: type II secretion system protein [Bdellovibrionales bacterium]|nr:type II secretion system protein [Bdellovibrionales bacterium]